VKHKTELHFEDLLVPIGLEKFVNENWDERSLFIPCENPDKRKLFDMRRLANAWQKGSPVKAGLVDTDGAYLEKEIDWKVGGEYLDRGATLCTMDLEDVDEELKAICCEARRCLGLAGNAFVNAYLSTRGQGFPMHYDVRGGIIIQVFGSKSWVFGRTPVVENPVISHVLSRELSAGTGGGRVSDVPVPADLEEAVLSPGDVLYLPAGTWHRGRAIDVSLGVTLSFRPITAVKLVGPLLEELARGNALLRKPLPAALKVKNQAKAEEGEAPLEVLAALSEQIAALREELDRVDAKRLALQWRRVFEGSDVVLGESS
jgi:ribosomal protein L16 Arg81 hydroxylase